MPLLHKVRSAFTQLFSAIQQAAIGDASVPSLLTRQANAKQVLQYSQAFSYNLPVGHNLRILRAQLDQWINSYQSAQKTLSEEKLCRVSANGML